MLRAATHAAPAEGPVDTVTLGYDERYRRRRAMTSDGGIAFLLDLPSAILLRAGDGLVLEDGRVIEIRAAPEAVVDLYIDDLPRLAWHLGNRHLPTQIFADRLRIRRDHVVEAMAERLGARLDPLEAPFDPEGGAYGHGAVHSHHDHAHGHPHDRQHDYGDLDRPDAHPGSERSADASWRR